MLRAHSDIKPFNIEKCQKNNSSFKETVLNKSLNSAIMATYSCSSSSSRTSSAYLSGKYAESNHEGSKSKTSSPVYQAQSNNSYQTYYANVANSTGTANSLLNGPLKLSVLNNLNEDRGVFYEHKFDEKNYKNKIDQLDLLTTVGTGTFGRVIVVRNKTTHEYYALKIMSIMEVLRLKQTEHVKNEKEILSQVNHPFIINLYWTCHSDRFLYMLLEFVCGGELFSYLRNSVRFPNETANFFAAEIVSALEYLHKHSIIYRDLKPENLLLDRQGHIRICDFGFAKKVYDRTWTLCGTPEYLAPEIIQGKGHHKAVDWWALGILMYEMLAGYPPFYDENPFQIYQKILAGKIEWPRYIDLVAKDLIRKLLVSDRTKRIGTMKNGAEDIKRHKWFKGIDWDGVIQKKLVPPIVPKTSSDGDTKNFDKYDEEGWKDVPMVSAKNLQNFEDF